MYLHRLVPSSLIHRSYPCFYHRASSSHGNNSLIDDIRAAMPKTVSSKHKKPKVRGKKENKTDIPSSKVSFKVFGDCRDGGVRSLLIDADKSRYMFNCSENTHRILQSEKKNQRVLNTLQGVFITKKSWQNLGGFPGICLSSRNSGNNSVVLHGPEYCLELFEAMKEFVVLYDFEVIHHSFEDGVAEDGTLSVEHVHLKPSGKLFYPPNPKHSPWVPLLGSARPSDEVRKSFLDQVYSKKSLPYDESVVAYIVTIKPCTSSVSMAKCLELKIPVGPLTEKLKCGETITLQSGKIVRPDEVCEPQDTPKKVLVVECPSDKYFGALRESVKLKFDDKDELIYVFHFTSMKVASHPEYKDWIAQFPSQTSHIMLNESGPAYGVAASYKFTEILKVLSPCLFPDVLYSDWQVLNGGLISDEPKVLAAKYQTTYAIKPKACIIEDQFPEESMAQFTIGDEKKDVQTKLSEKNFSLQNMPQPDLSKPSYPKVTFLGTCSGRATKYRTVTAILVETKPDIFILLDCGEGTLQQLTIHFGPVKADQILCNLKAIFTSHRHADHHLGLVSIIQARQRAFSKQGLEVELLNLLSTGKMSYFLRYFHSEFEPILEECKQVRLEHLLLFTPPGSDEKVQVYFENQMNLLLESLGLKSIVSSRALHCAHAFSIALTTESDFKILFTGDTRPCRELIELGLHEKSPDLLIHEATLEQQLHFEARAKMHSTFTEAIENGMRMKAKFTMLTHFSQRYYKFPPLNEIRGHENVGIAFDHMTVNPQTLHLIEPMYDMLEVVFAQDFEEMSKRSEKYVPYNWTPQAQKKVVSKTLNEELEYPKYFKQNKSEWSRKSKERKQLSMLQMVVNQAKNSAAKK